MEVGGDSVVIDDDQDLGFDRSDLLMAAESQIGERLRGELLTVDRAIAASSDERLDLAVDRGEHGCAELGMVNGGDVMHAVRVDAPRRGGSAHVAVRRARCPGRVGCGEQASTATLEIFR